MRRAAWVAGLVAAAIAAWLALRPPGPGAPGPSITDRSAARHADAGSLSAKVISSEDLPPEGTRSLFDHVIAQNELLPYPFDKLLSAVRRRDPEEHPLVALLIPQGRSLLKAQADYAHPRIVAAADYQAADSEASLGLAPRGQLFLGFVENAAEIEVISYNEAAGRFEFQLVQNYCDGCVPRIVYARRAICTTCHQGATPIFPQRPWNETNGQPQVGEQIVAARGAGPYLGVPATNPLSVPERFDELTDIGNFFAITQRAWLDGCGAGAASSASTARGGSGRPRTDARAGVSTEGSGGGTDAGESGSDGNACRRQMLKLALRFQANPGSFDAQSADAAALRQLQAKHWPKGGIEVFNNDLFNRDPLGESRGFRAWLRGLFAKKPEPGAGARNNEDLAAFDQLPKLPAELDPLTPRAGKRLLTADDLDGVFGLTQFFTASDAKRLEQAAGYDAKTLEAAVDRLDAAFFEPAVFSRVKTMRALLAALKAKAPDYCCLETKALSPPVASGVPPLALAADSPLKDFERFCFACHRGNPSARLNFMAGKDEAEVLKNVKAKSEIRDALDWPRYQGTDKENKLMPPADSRQRKDLEQALAQNPRQLEEMRKVVPSLFDF